MPPRPSAPTCCSRPIPPSAHAALVLIRTRALGAYRVPSQVRPARGGGRFPPAVVEAGIRHATPQPRRREALRHVQLQGAISPELIISRTISPYLAISPQISSDLAIILTLLFCLPPKACTFSIAHLELSADVTPDGGLTALRCWASQRFRAFEPWAQVGAISTHLPPSMTCSRPLSH